MNINDSLKATIISRLHHEQCSCVIYNNGTTTVCSERGVKDLFRLLTTQHEVLSGAFIADKVVGKGAAALMALGGVTALYADVISVPALEMLQKEGVEVSYGTCATHIVNRAGNGICPVEKLCADCTTAAECLPLITEFINTMQKTK